MVGTLPALLVVDAAEVPWDEVTTVGAVPSEVVTAFEQRRTGRIRFGEGSDGAPAVLRSSFEPRGPPRAGRTVPAPPPDELVELFSPPAPPSACAHDAPTLELVGTWSFELRSHGRWIAADTVGVRILVQDPDPAAACVITGRGFRAALPTWPAERMGVPEATEQEVWVDRSTDLDHLTVWGSADPSHTWTFAADPR